MQAHRKTVLKSQAFVVSKMLVEDQGCSRIDCHRIGKKTVKLVAEGKTN